jgi:hypothetical protein
MSRPPQFGESGRSHTRPAADPHAGVLDGLVAAAAFVLVAANIAGFIVGVPEWLLWWLAFALGVNTVWAWRLLTARDRS